MDVGELIARALAGRLDTAEGILYGAAAFDALTDDPMVLVGGGAQVSHTGVGRPTDIDLVGRVSAEDESRLVEAGFTRKGRHWVHESKEGVIAVEVPGSGLTPEETYEEIELEGAVVRVISVTDLMIDRLIQATDGTHVTRDEATQLAVAAGHRVDWEAVEERANRVAETSGFLRGLPKLVAEFRSLTS